MPKFQYYCYIGWVGNHNMSEQHAWHSMNIIASIIITYIHEKIARTANHQIYTTFHKATTVHQIWFPVNFLAIQFGTSSDTTLLHQKQFSLVPLFQVTCSYACCITLHTATHMVKMILYLTPPTTTLHGLVINSHWARAQIMIKSVSQYSHPPTLWPGHTGWAETCRPHGVLP